ncbi:expressed protein [Phakopsora pachyrhizi]|uniref:RNA polymerase II-associated protein 3 n=1 Tax=Phakopsora pachyrhizi TaxID=170000 RepID=A0AAV0AZC4_PHAPC|nr:expressed protein [Phakopsora pachyrhizi]
MVQANPNSDFSKPSSAAEFLKGQGNAAFKAGNYQVAIEYYSSAIKSDPSDHILPCNRAMAHLKLNQWKSAEADCTRSLDLLPVANCKALFRRGIARKNLQLWDRALKDLVAASSLEPSNKSILSELDELRAHCKKFTPDSVSPLQSSSSYTDDKASQSHATSTASDSDSSSSDEESEPSNDKAAPSSSKSLTEGDGFLREISSRKISSSETRNKINDTNLTGFGELKRMRQEKEQKAYSVMRADFSTSIRKSKHFELSQNHLKKVSIIVDEGLKAQAIPIKNFNEFERRWTSSACLEARWEVLQSLDPKALRNLFGDHLEPDVLEQILEAVDHAVSSDDIGKITHAARMIEGIDRVSRLGTIKMLLDPKSLEIVKKVIEIFSKRAPSSSMFRLENWET